MRKNNCRTHGFTASSNLLSPPAPLEPTLCLLLVFHLLSIILFPLSILFSLSFQRVLKRRQRGGRFSPSSHQLATTTEKLPNESAADEEQKWDKLLFINTERREVCICVLLCVCMYSMYVVHLHMWQIPQPFNSLAIGLINHIWDSNILFEQSRTGKEGKPTLSSYLLTSHYLVWN